MAMLGCCGEAIDLHVKIYEYVLNSDLIDLPDRSLIIFSETLIQMHATICRHNKLYHIFHDHTVQFGHLFVSICDRNGIYQQAIHYHRDAREMSNYSVILKFQLEHSEDILLPLLTIVVGLETLLVYFYFGQMCHSNLIELNDTIYQSEWHRYPRRVKYCVQFIIMRAQKPFYISAYGLVHCRLENFVSVSCVYSMEELAVYHYCHIHTPGAQINVFCIYVVAPL